MGTTTDRSAAASVVALIDVAPDAATTDHLQLDRLAELAAALSGSSPARAALAVDGAVLRGDELVDSLGVVAHALLDLRPCIDLRIPPR